MRRRRRRRRQQKSAHISTLNPTSVVSIVAGFLVIPQDAVAVNPEKRNFARRTQFPEDKAKKPKIKKMKAGQVREIVVSSLFSTCVVGLLAQFVLLERELEFTGGKHLKLLFCFIYVGNLDEFAAALMRRLNDDRGGGGVRQVEPAMPTEEEEEEVNTISRFNRSFFPSSILFSVANLHLFRPTEPWGGSDLGEKFCRGALTKICFNCVKQTSDGQEEEDGGGGLGPRGLRWVLRDGEAARGLRPPTVHVGVILRNLARASTAHKSRRLREQFVTMLLRYEDEKK